MDQNALQADASAWVAATAIGFVTGWVNPRVAASCHLHQHPCHELVMHPRGRGTSRLSDGRELSFTPGDLVWYPPELGHDQLLAESGEDWCIHFSSSISPLIAIPRVVALGSDLNLLADLRSLAQCSQGRTQLARARIDLRVKAALVGILEHALAGSSSNGGDDIAARHAAALHRHLAEHVRDPGRLSSFAANRGIGEDHLRHCFTNRYGMSPVRWLIRLRIERAQELLEHSDMNMEGIATACGFATARYFCAIFRRETGCTPGTFRKNVCHGQT